MGRIVVAAGVSVALAQLWLPDRWMLQTWIAAGTPWIYLPALPLLAFALFRRRWPESLALALVTACWIAWVAPLVVSDARGEPDLSVATINALAWNADHAGAARDIAAIDADILAIQEVSPELAAALRLFAVHTLPPFGPHYAEVWRTQSKALVHRVADEVQPLVVAGDLNATPFHRIVRELESLGISDGHAAVGRGLATTFPTDRWLPSMLLDHVLASDELAFTTVEERSIAGSDHEAVVAGLRWND